MNIIYMMLQAEPLNLALILAILLCMLAMKLVSKKSD